MLKILTAAQLREVDAYTIKSLSIPAIELMEKASKAFVSKFKSYYPNKQQSITIFCGKGNNGGDGLAIARILSQDGYHAISVWIIDYTNKSTADFEINLNRLKEEDIPLFRLKPEDTFPEINTDLIIDALLGTGLNQPLQDNWEALISHINHTKKTIISVDLPTGLMPEGNLSIATPTIHAQRTITFQRPKIAFFFPESALATTYFHVVDIGLDEHYLQSLPSDTYWLRWTDAQRLIKPRHPFSHKGTYGHAAIIAGNQSTMGAAILCAESCMIAGAGLITAYPPQEGFQTFNTRTPEIMTAYREHLFDHLNSYNALAIGPGLGTDLANKDLLKRILQEYKGALVLDADALNLLAQMEETLSILPKHSILTPHMKEFDRMFGQHATWYSRVEKAKQMAKEYSITIVLKNRFTFIASPDGSLHINTTGNPSMASGGMGDVLTGIITSFLAQGYSHKEATCLAVCIHGAAGDAWNKEGLAIVHASKIIEKIPKLLYPVNLPE